jgi:hypothetical protein
VVRAVVFTSSSFIVLLLQLCLVIFSPSKVGNSVLNTVFCPTRPALGSITCPALGGWLFAPPPALSICASFDLCLLLVALLGVCLVALPLLSAFVAFHLLRVWFFAPCPFSRAGSVFYLHLCFQCSIRVQCLCFSVLFGGVQSPQGLQWIMFPGDW